MDIIYSTQVKTSNWTGGSTTELFIYPKQANYKKLNFDFRISKAKVEIENSSFTDLPGVKRTLMVLAGSLKLSHKGRYNKSLKPFEFDNFSGDWQTECAGTGIDFNLMISNPKMEGFLSHLCLLKSEVHLFEARQHTFLHLFDGSVEVNNDFELSNGDSLYFENFETVRLSAKTQTNLIMVEIKQFEATEAAF